MKVTIVDPVFPPRVAPVDMADFDLLVRGCLPSHFPYDHVARAKRERRASAEIAAVLHWYWPHHGLEPLVFFDTGAAKAVVLFREIETGELITDGAETFRRLQERGRR